MNKFQVQRSEWSDSIIEADYFDVDEFGVHFFTDEEHVAFFPRVDGVAIVLGGK